jgi:hypothetical protein
LVGYFFFALLFEAVRLLVLAAVFFAAGFAVRVVFLPVVALAIMGLP